MATTPSSDPIVILSYARTPMGSFQGNLASVSATELGATAIQAAIERAGVSGDQVDKVFMGNVLPAGLGQAPARQAALGAGLPRSTAAFTAVAPRSVADTSASAPCIAPIGVRA